MVKVPYISFALKLTSYKNRSTINRSLEKKTSFLYTSIVTRKRLKFSLFSPGVSAEMLETECVKCLLQNCMHYKCCKCKDLVNGDSHIQYYSILLRHFCWIITASVFIEIVSIKSTNILQLFMLIYTKAKVVRDKRALFMIKASNIFKSCQIILDELYNTRHSIYMCIYLYIYAT